MATTFTARLKLAKQANADNIGAWEVPLNLGFDDADARFFKTGVVTPIGAGSPDEDADYIGQRYFDTVTELWYTAKTAGTPGVWIQSEVGQLNNSVQSLEAGLASALPTPAAATAGSIYIETDTKLIKRDTGTAYDTLVAPAPFGYLAGLGLSQGADALHDIDVAAGECRSAQDDIGMKISSVFTKRIDAPWAVGTGNGGLFSGAAAGDTWYHYFGIVKDSDLSVDFGFDINVNASNIPAGYTSYRRLGSIKTKLAAAEIEPFTQINDRFEYTDQVITTGVTITSSSAVTVILKGAPPGVKCLARGWVKLDFTGGPRYYWIKSLNQTDDVPSNINSSHTHPDSSFDVQQTHPEWEAMTDTSQSIHARKSSATEATQFGVLSYDDYRGKDGQGAV